MPALERHRMSYDDYQALPESVRAEWVDGEVVVSPTASFGHQQVSRRLANLIDDALPDLVVVEAVGVHLAGNRERIPDIVVVERGPDAAYVTDVPALVVEILSPTTRSEDTVRKSTEYLRAGIGQYWLVDPERRIVEIFQNTSSGWDLLAQVDDTDPDTVVPVSAHGEVRLNLSGVLDA